MAEPIPIVNFEGMEGVHTYVLDTRIADSNYSRSISWGTHQVLNLETIRSYLPEDEQYRADDIVNLHNTPYYRSSRINRNIDVGDGLRDDQLYRYPLMAVVSRGMEDLAAVLSDLNTSATRLTPKPFKPLDYKLKMHMEPQWRVPVLGGHRHVAFRESYSKRDAQPPLEDIDPAVVVVAGVEVIAVYRSLQFRNPDDGFVVYKAVGDPADQGTINLADAIGMPPGKKHPNNKNKLYRVKDFMRSEVSVGQVMENIENLEGAEDVIRTTGVSLVTRELADRYAESERRRVARQFANSDRQRSRQGYAH